VLTAARTGETIGATWPEIAADATWIVPGERMKAHKEHRIPLCARAVAILDEMKPYRDADGGFVFPGAKKETPLSNMSMAAVLKRMEHDAVTVHGFRSSFRDWAAEQTSFPREVVEMALAHSIENKAEAAYRRGDLFEKRRKLMDAWERHCESAISTGRPSKARQKSQPRTAA
jgi:integrase